MATRIYALANQKGGVGKTTTAINLATGLAACGQQVLLIDADPQGNASTGLGVLPNQREKNLYDVLIDRVQGSEALVQTCVDNVTLIPATVDLAAAEVELMQLDRPQYVMKSYLDRLGKGYDAVIIDCPPALGLLTINSLVAANRVLVPLQTEFYALEGLAHLLKTIETVRKHFNPALSLQGVILTMYDKRNKLSEVVANDVRSYLGSRVFDTVIPRNVKVSEAPSHGKPAILYDVKSSGAQAYIALAAELLKREGISIQAPTATASPLSKVSN
ncbi:MAG: ParA family protein [Alphaproteobacteria bacterium]